MNRNSVFLVILLCLNILAWLAAWDLSQPHLLEVIFFDVGQGDAILIQGTIGKTLGLRW
ncbi:MAG: hypothetical protein ABH805_02540 [Candidatus Nealsonbacteria bacterium]